MSGVGEDGIVCLGVKGTSQERRVSFDGEEGNMVEGRDKIRNATNAEAMFHGIGDPQPVAGIVCLSSPRVMSGGGVFVSS